MQEEKRKFVDVFISPPTINNPPRTTLIFSLFATCHCLLPILCFYIYVYTVYFFLISRYLIKEMQFGDVKNKRQGTSKQLGYGLTCQVPML